MKRHFTYITLADFIVRSAYQMGKTPLLPIFAASLGATGAFLGLIVSVSTVTGLVLKPLFGILSDRWGRRAWLIIGTLFFTVIPFLYRFIGSPEELFALRLVHGLSTAIYGPVTLAYIAEQSSNRIAEEVGWFEMARSGGYIVGPAFAGWLLLSIEPAAIFTMIGLLSAVAFAPILLLEESSALEKKGQTEKLTPQDSPHPLNPPLPTLGEGEKSSFISPSPKVGRGGRGVRAVFGLYGFFRLAQQERPPLKKQVVEALKAGGQTPAIWLAGSLKGASLVALYIIKAFLPVYGLSIGLNVALVGLFFSVQEGAHILFKAAGGRLGDKLGHLMVIGLGMMLLSFTLPWLTLSTSDGSLLLLAALMGLAQALIFPSTIALISNQVNQAHLGAAMGLAGMMDNFGKVIGPVLGGLLIERLGFAPTLTVIALLLLGGGLAVLSFHLVKRNQIKGKSWSKSEVR